MKNKYNINLSKKDIQKIEGFGFNPNEVDEITVRMIRKTDPRLWVSYKLADMYTEFVIQDYEIIIKSSDFKDLITNVRNKMNIPALAMNEDAEIHTIYFDDSSYDEGVSIWLNLQSKNKQQLVDKVIKELIYDCGLPSNFYGWIQSYVLYNEQPSGKPLYDDKLLDKIINSEVDIAKFGLTSKAKKDIKMLVKFGLGITPKGRTSKVYQKSLNEFFKKIDDAPSPKRRKWRTMETSKKAMNKPKNVTYDKLLGELSSVDDTEDISTTADKRGVQVLRQLKTRYKKRIKRFDKKSEN